MYINPQHLPTRRMAGIVQAAKEHQKRERRRRWVERHIVCDDPHPDLDTSAGIGPWMFLAFVALSCAFYLTVGWAIFHP